MVKVIQCLMFALVVAIVGASSALAKVQDFGEFTVDVPAGWETRRDGDAVVMVSPKNTCVISVKIGKMTREKTLKSLADETAKALGGTEPDRDEDGDYAFSYTHESGVEGYAVIRENGGNYYLVTILGQHPQAEDVIDSFEDK